jgi:hypothetical protein
MTFEQLLHSSRTAEFLYQPLEPSEFKRRVRNRIRLLAAERGLPDSEVGPVLSRFNDIQIMKFAERHQVSLDWLLCGCIKGRLRMAKRSRDPSWLTASKIEGGKHA